MDGPNLDGSGGCPHISQGGGQQRRVAARESERKCAEVNVAAELDVQGALHDGRLELRSCRDDGDVSIADSSGLGVPWVQLQQRPRPGIPFSHSPLRLPRPLQPFSCSPLHMAGTTSSTASPNKISRLHARLRDLPTAAVTSEQTAAQVDWFRPGKSVAWHAPASAGKAGASPDGALSVDLLLEQLISICMHSSYMAADGCSQAQAVLACRRKHRPKEVDSGTYFPRAARHE